MMSRPLLTMAAIVPLYVMASLRKNSDPACLEKDLSGLMWLQESKLRHRESGPQPSR